MDMAIPGDLKDSHVTLTNNGKTSIGSHEITCWINRVKYGLLDFDRSAATTIPHPNEKLLAGGDEQTETCLKDPLSLLRDNQPSSEDCADLSISIEYSLTSQPAIKKVKYFGFATEGHGAQMKWYRIPAERRETSCR
jgi:hypothetical protein